jgi:nucleotide-binding universal stress UspA family protein
VLPAPGVDTELAADRPHQSPQVLYEDAQRQMQAYKVRFPESQLEIVNGDPAEEIILLANIHKADLIVIGNRGLKGVKRIIEGSVSSQVVADAPCSVFVVKAKKSEQ